MAFSDSIYEYLKGWMSLLSGVWGFLIWPFAVVALCNKRRKIIGVILLVLVGLFISIFLHDLHAHFNNRRPWVPFYEWCFGLLIPVEGRSSIFAVVPFDSEGVTVKVVHVRRGNHSIGIWIPIKMDDFTPVGPDVRLNCNFLDRYGKVIFQVHSDSTFKKLWTWCRGDRGGSSEVYCKYSVPEDVPLDEELVLQINVSGEVRSFLRAYPNAIFTVEKYSDK